MEPGEPLGEEPAPLGAEDGALPVSGAPLGAEDVAVLLGAEPVPLGVEEGALPEPESAPFATEGELPPFCWATPLGVDPVPPGAEGGEPAAGVDKAYGTGELFVEGVESAPSVEVMLQGFLVREWL